jgi:hypothetical protein
MGHQTLTHKATHHQFMGWCRDNQFCASKEIITSQPSQFPLHFALFQISSSSIHVASTWSIGHL